MMTGCGCKICKAGLGEFANELIITGESPIKVLAELEKKGLKVTKKLLKKHLAAFDIEYPSENWDGVEIDAKPVTVDLNTVDFSEYEFDIGDPNSVIIYLQKLNLKVYLNQMKITLQMQQEVIDGKIPEIPASTLRNLALAYQLLDKSTAIGIQINEAKAIKIVESLGLITRSEDV